jgi:hypothetical protein
MDLHPYDIVRHDITRHDILKCIERYFMFIELLSNLFECKIPVRLIY